MFVYADNAATTKLSQVALDAMLPYLTDVLRQPLEPALRRPEGRGDAVRPRADDRRSLPRLSGRARFIFTSGGSEADNQAIVSAAPARRKARARSTSSPPAFEHHAVLHTLKKLEKEGFEVDAAAGRAEIGTVTAEQVKAAIRPDTCLVTIMYANNEIGTVPAHRGNRRGLPRSGRPLPHRRRAGGGPSAHQRAGAEHRHALPLRPQVPRAEGRRRALCAQGHHSRRTSLRAAHRSAASARAPRTSPASSAWRRR